jgi:hypothetical protein
MSDGNSANFHGTSSCGGEMTKKSSGIKKGQKRQKGKGMKGV